MLNSRFVTGLKGFRRPRRVIPSDMMERKRRFYAEDSAGEDPWSIIIDQDITLRNLSDKSWISKILDRGNGNRLMINWLQTFKRKVRRSRRVIPPDIIERKSTFYAEDSAGETLDRLLLIRYYDNIILKYERPQTSDWI